MPCQPTGFVTSGFGVCGGFVVWLNIVCGGWCLGWDVGIAYIAYMGEMRGMRAPMWN